MSDDDLVGGLLALLAERDRLIEQVRSLGGDADAARYPDPEQIRKAYRRGYLAGRDSQRRGAPAVTNPERNARGWIREALR